VTWTGAGLAGAGDTGDMLRTVNWVARALGFAWLGVLAFLISPPHRPSATAVQAAGYCLLGLGLLAWALIDVHPAAQRQRTRWLAIILAVIAVATGFASAAGSGGGALLAFTFVAALIAGGETSLAVGVAVTGAGVLAFNVSGLVYGGSYQVLLGVSAVLIGGLVIGRNWGGYRIQAEQSAMLLAQREQLEAEQRRADLLDERARIAREIHDVLAHSLGALGIQIQAARAVLTDHRDIDRAGEILAGAQKMAAEGLVETRRAVHALRTDSLPLAEELARVSDTHAQRYLVPASFDTGGVPGPLPPDATVALLRVAQESLVNAAKHAAGQRVAVRLDYRDTDVRLSVRNDLASRDGADVGAGENDAAGVNGAAVVNDAARVSSLAEVSTVNGGYGLTGMRERLRLLNGTLEAGRRDNQWVVTAELPRPRLQGLVS
jgi:signal transduction histidine kinase